MKFLIFSTPE